MTEPLVSTGWLAAELGRPDLVLFDATKYLPNEGLEGETLFRAAHIPTARFFDIDLVADPETDLPHMVPTQGRFQRLMRQMGVGADSRVVFYDQKGLASSARGWWLMGLFGHDRAAVLDGGLPKWRAEGRPLDMADEGQDGPAPAPPPAPPAHPFVATLRAARLRGIGDLLAPEPGRLILDARPPGRFAGSTPEPRPGLPSGHIPGARNVPVASLLAADGTLLPPARLREILQAAGARPDRAVVTSCGTGVTATILSLALVRAGLPIGAVYDGSWTEWAARPDTPKETS